MTPEEKAAKREAVNCGREHELACVGGRASAAKGRPHSLLVAHSPLARVSTWGHTINGYAPGCLACQEGALPPCWCGGEVGPRAPGDHLGLGCLADISHDWHGTPCRYTTSTADYCHAHDGHLASPAGNCDAADAYGKGGSSD